jgi:transposase
MAIVGGLDIHRRQITYDWIDTDSGETCRGQLSPATRVELRAWLARFTGQQADFALEATTGWRFVAEELERAGCAAHLAEPADTRALRGPKRRAKTDRTDAHHLRELLRAGTLPESWMPPPHIADARTQVRLRRALVGERTGWYQRIHAILFHHGLPERSQLLTADGRAWLASIHLPAVARQAVEVALRMIDHLEVELDTLDAQLAGIARVQPGCQALQRRYGIGWLTAGGDLGRVRRRAPLRQLPPGGPLLWPGYHYHRVGRQARPRAPGPPGLPGAALGTARGGHVRRPPWLPRPPLLPPGQTAAGWQAGRAVGGPQAGPRGLPHPTRTRRPGAGPRRAANRRLNWPASCAPGRLNR